MLIDRDPPRPAYKGVVQVDRGDRRIFFDGFLALELAGARDKRHLACDIESAGLGAASFDMRCVTFSDGDTSVVLDPRDPEQARTIRIIIRDAGGLIFHNAAYDIPVLINNGLMDYSDTAKVWDTVIYARMAQPSPLVSKTLEALAQRHLGMADHPIAAAFRAAGHATKELGFAGMDVDSFVYCNGAMMDTRATFHLLPVVQAEARAALEAVQDGPWSDWAAQDIDYLLHREQTVNRMMLHAGARGMVFDTEYYGDWKAKHDQTIEKAAARLSEMGIDPGNGQHLVKMLSDLGELPKGWPVTDSGLLGARAADVEKLTHPAAVAHLAFKRLTRVDGYLAKCASMASVTGRVHPMAGTFGASATGRMSYSAPELQQFPGDARGVLCADAGHTLVSIDWSAIEPCIMANIAGEADMLAAYEAGEDIYAPVMTTAGVSRKDAKVVLLAGMYGQGIELLASNLSQARGAVVDVEEAGGIKRAVMDSMPNVRNALTAIKRRGESHGYIVTVSGRPLPVPEFNGKYAGYKGQNYEVQGSAYDQLAETIVAGYDRGLAGTLRLAMHDEIVSDDDAAAEWQELMQIPAPALCRAVDRTPVLRTDLLDLGVRWSKPE